MTLRVGIDARFVDPAYPGIGRYVSNLIPALTRQAGIGRVCVFHRTEQPLDPLARGARPDTLLWIRVRARVRSLAEQLELPRLAQRHRLDVFHAPYVLAPMRLPCPMVVNVYDLIPLRPDGGLSTPRRAAFRQLVRLAMRRADVVVALSEAARAQINATFPRAPTPIHVTPAAAGEEFRPIGAAASRAALAGLSLPESYLLYVGARRPHKNLARLLEAWGRLGDDRQGAQLLLAGATGGDEMPSSSAAASRELDNVRILGRIPNAVLPPLYSRAQGYVQPSIEEGFGFTVLEAMACGVPVACSATAGLRELTGSAAIHFDPFNTGSIAAALRHLLADERGRADRIRAGLWRAAELDWNHTAASTVEIYRDIARPAARVA